jgi:hypothetical protein
MSMAIFAVPTVLAPLQCLWRWLWPDAAQGTPLACNRTRHDHQAVKPLLANTNCYSKAKPKNLFNPSFHRPLRVVRVLEVGQTRAQVGRMVISGRMADVCAELDRLAAFDAE